MLTAQAIIKTSPRWQGLEVTGKRLDNGELELGNPIIITCHGHGTTTERTHEGPWCAECTHPSCELIRPTYICAECLEDFERVLADVPWLLDDLDIAISGDVHFVEHGVRMGTLESDAAGPSRHPAVSAHHRLCLAILGDGTGAHPGCRDWFNARSPLGLALNLRLYLHRLAHEPRMPVLAHDISSAAKRAHHVIDMPKDLVLYGPCPECGRDIFQERIHRDDQETKVTCRYPSCGFTETLDLYYKRVLKANLDRQFSITECVGMLSNAGQVVTRDQINGWIRHRGLPREWTDRPEWKNGSLVMVGMWTLKLRDVVDFIAEREKKVAS